MIVGRLLRRLGFGSSKQEGRDEFHIYVPTGEIGYPKAYAPVYGKQVWKRYYRLGDQGWADLDLSPYQAGDIVLCFPVHFGADEFTRPEDLKSASDNDLNPCGMQLLAYRKVDDEYEIKAISSFAEGEDVL